MNKKELIDELLIGNEFLKCDIIYERDIGFVRNVLKMPEWKEERF